MPDYTLSGSDGHSSALVELYALLLEKEGQAPNGVIENIREEATLMAEEARSEGRPVLTLDALMMFCASQTQPPDEPVSDNGEPSERKAWNAPFEVGEIVCAGITGAPARLVQLFDPEDFEIAEGMRGMANIRLPRSTGIVTIEAVNLRRASPVEITAYHDAGGR